MKIGKGTVNTHKGVFENLDEKTVELFNFIQEVSSTLNEETRKELGKLPVLVVIGDQSVGKSFTLGRLVNIDFFPDAAKEGTIAPTVTVIKRMTTLGNRKFVVRMKDNNVPVHLVSEDNGKLQHGTYNDDIATSVNSLQDLQNKVRWTIDAISKDRVKKGKTISITIGTEKRSTKFSHEPIQLEIESADQPFSISFVDLPGLKGSNCPIEDTAAVDEVVKQFISDKTKDPIFLLLMDGQQDPEKGRAFGFLKQFGPEDFRNRTIGVVNFVSTAGIEFTQTICSEDRYRLRSGYHLLASMHERKELDVQFPTKGQLKDYDGNKKTLLEESYFDALVEKNIDVGRIIDFHRKLRSKMGISSVRGHVIKSIEEKVVGVIQKEVITQLRNIKSRLARKVSSAHKFSDAEGNERTRQRHLRKEFSLLNKNLARAVDGVEYILELNPDLSKKENLHKLAEHELNPSKFLFRVQQLAQWVQDYSPFNSEEELCKEILGKAEAFKGPHMIKSLRREFCREYLSRARAEIADECIQALNDVYNTLNEIVTKVVIETCKGSLITEEFGLEVSRIMKEKNEENKSYAQKRIMEKIKDHIVDFNLKVNGKRGQTLTHLSKESQYASIWQLSLFTMAMFDNMQECVHREVPLLIMREMIYWFYSDKESIEHPVEELLTAHEDELIKLFKGTQEVEEDIKQMNNIDGLLVKAEEIRKKYPEVFSGPKLTVHRQQESNKENVQSRKVQSPMAPGHILQKDKVQSEDDEEWLKDQEQFNYQQNYNKSKRY
jgi:hypothetical protein